MGTLKNRLIETILLSTHNIGLEGQIRILELSKRPYLELCCEYVDLPTVEKLYLEGKYGRVNEYLFSTICPLTHKVERFVLH